MWKVEIGSKNSTFSRNLRNAVRLAFGVNLMVEAWDHINLSLCFIDYEIMSSPCLRFTSPHARLDVVQNRSQGLIPESHRASSCLDFSLKFDPCEVFPFAISYSTQVDSAFRTFLPYFPQSHINITWSSNFYSMHSPTIPCTAQLIGHLWINSVQAMGWFHFGLKIFQRALGRPLLTKWANQDPGLLHIKLLPPM